MQSILLFLPKYNINFYINGVYLILSPNYFIYTGFSAIISSFERNSNSYLYSWEIYFENNLCTIFL